MPSRAYVAIHLCLGKSVFTHLTGLAHQHKDIPSLGGKIGLHVDKTVKYYLNRRKFTMSSYVHPDFINMNSRAGYSHSYMLTNTQSKQLKLTSLDLKGKYYPFSRPLGVKIGLGLTKQIVKILSLLAQ